MQPGNIIDLKYNREAKQHGGQNKKFQILGYQKKVRNREKWQKDNLEGDNEADPYTNFKS